MRRGGKQAGSLPSDSAGNALCEQSSCRPMFSRTNCQRKLFQRFSEVTHVNAFKPFSVIFGECAMSANAYAAISCGKQIQIFLEAKNDY